MSTERAVLPQTLLANLVVVHEEGVLPAGVGEQLRLEAVGRVL